MEIHSYSCYILINCVLLFPSFLTKPVSLNDIIAAEEQGAHLLTPQLKVSETKTNIRRLPKSYKTFMLTKHMTSGSIAQTNKKISPLTYKKTFQIRTPLRPKKVKYSYKPRSRRINTTAKREIDNDEKYSRNYIPLLKNLSVLFNNILRSDSEPNIDEDIDEYDNNQQSISRSEECPCAHKSKHKTTGPKPAKKTTALTSSVTSKVSTKAKTHVLPETSSTSTYNSFNDNISPIGRHKNLPILSTGDSVSSWRNYNGFSEGSLSTYNRNFEGYIAGNNGSYENNNSRRKATKSHTENHKQYTNSSSGDDASCNGSCRTIGRNRHITSNTTNEVPTIETIVGSNETFRSYRGEGNQSEGFDKLETRRNKKESRILLSESSSRLRRFESHEETTEILWQIENPQESFFDVTYNFTRNQRLSNRDSTMAPEDKEIRRTNKQLTSDNLYTSSANTSGSNLNKDKQKVVVIYDGYSIARDVNGENKLTEQAYRIHS